MLEDVFLGLHIVQKILKHPLDAGLLKILE